MIQAVACSDGRKLVGEKGLRAELATTVRAGLGEDHLGVVLDGPRGDEELGRDSSGVEALRDGFDLPEQVLDYRA